MEENKSTKTIEETTNELSFTEKIKYNILSYKINKKEKQIKTKCENAKIKLQKAQEQLDKILEIEKIVAEELSNEKRNLQLFKEQALLNSKNKKQITHIEENKNNNEKTIEEIEEQLTEKEIAIYKESIKLEKLTQEKYTEENEENIKNTELKIKKLFIERQKIKKTLSNLINEEKFEEIVSELKDIKSEFSNSEEKFYQITKNNGEVKNIIFVVFETIIYYFSKIVLRKELQKYNYTSSAIKNIKVKVILAPILAIMLSLISLLTIKLISSEKETYGDYSNFINPVQEEQSQEQKTTTTTETNNVERINEIALEEELEAQSSFKTITYYFNVDRTIVTKEKIHTFLSENWSDIGSIIPVGTTVNVNLMTSPGGYMMYKIVGGEYDGQFITANTSLVEVKTKNDFLNAEFYSKPIAIKIVQNSNSYYDSKLTQFKEVVYKDAVLNINGLGVVNNRLVYYITNGTFVPVDFGKIIETNRDQKNSTTTTTR